MKYLIPLTRKNILFWLEVAQLASRVEFLMRRLTKTILTYHCVMVGLQENLEALSRRPRNLFLEKSRNGKFEMTEILHLPNLKYITT